MDNELFNDLVQSIKQAGQIHAGKLKPSREFKFDPIDIKQIREDLGLSQQEFALTIGVSHRTLQNWEQGHRLPQGPALALLTIFKNDPTAAIAALHGAS
jgi:putative transcriptional regulator